MLIKHLKIGSYFFDNLSTDNSKKIFDSFKDSRFHYFNFSESLKLGDARKKAWKEIQSQYVAICDVDDVFYDNRFKDQLEYLDNNENCSVVGSNVYLIDKFSNKIQEVNHYLSNKELKQKININMFLIVLLYYLENVLMK